MSRKSVIKNTCIYHEMSQTVLNKTSMVANMWIISFVLFLLIKCVHDKYQYFEK